MLADLDDALASQDIMKLLQVVHDIELKCYTVRLMKVKLTFCMFIFSRVQSGKVLFEFAN